MNPDPREIAWTVMARTRTEGAYVNLLVPTLIHEHRLSPRDAAFLTELVNGTVRRQGSYDAIIDSLTSTVDDDVRDVLRLGAHQILSMRVPSHAAVSSSVNLTKRVIGHKPTGLVNAVLRKISARDFEDWMDALNASDAVRYSHPQWIVDAYREVLSEVETREVMDANNQAPRVTLVARPGLLSPTKLPGKPGRLSPYARILDSGNPGEIDAVRDGRAAIQDEGSQWVVTSLVDVELAGSDVHWLDMCAGPGGKAALLAAIGAQRGATVIANDIIKHRAELVSKTSAQLRNIEITNLDARTADWPENHFDRILIDAPCTGLGALRRRPEARWRKAPADVDELTQIQTDLLNRAAELIRHGGVIAYATCSPHRAETHAIVEAFLAQHPDFERVRPDQQLWPHTDGTDAMFLALLRRR